MPWWRSGFDPRSARSPGVEGTCGQGEGGAVRAGWGDGSGFPDVADVGPTRHGHGSTSRLLRGTGRTILGGVRGR
jgi:hypothetical protein